MQGLNCSGNLFPRRCVVASLRNHLTSAGSSHPSHLGPTASEALLERPRPPPRGGGFPGDTPPRPLGPAPGPSVPPLPPPPPAGVALPAASRSGGGGGSSRGGSLFSAAAGWIVSIKVFFLARSLSSGEQAEASVRSRRVRKRRTRRERKRPPAVSGAPHGPAAEKKEPSSGRAASAGRHLPARLAPAQAPPRGLVGCPRGPAAREPCCPGGLATREGPAAPPGGSGPSARAGRQRRRPAPRRRLGSASRWDPDLHPVAAGVGRAAHAPRLASRRGPRTCW